MAKASVINDKNEDILVIGHQQSSTSKITKKKQRQISERSKLKDTWNTPEFLAQFTSRTRQRKPAQANRAAQRAKEQASQQAAEGQYMPQAENMTVDQPAHVNPPTIINSPANTNTMAQYIVTPVQPKSLPSSLLSHKRKATNVDVDGNLNVNTSDQQPQRSEKAIVVEVTDNRNDVFQPLPLPLKLQPAARSLAPKPKARASPKSKAPAKSKAPRKKVEPKATTSPKQKTVVKAALTSTLALANVQSAVPLGNVVSTPSYTDLFLRHRAPPNQDFTDLSSINAHMQLPDNSHTQLPANAYVHPSVSADSLSSNHGYSEYYLESTTPFPGPPRPHTGAMASFYRDLASCYQDSAPFAASDVHSSSLAMQHGWSNSRTDTALAPMNSDLPGADATVTRPAPTSETTLGVNNTEGITETRLQQALPTHDKPRRKRPATIPKVKRESLKAKAKASRSKSKGQKAEPVATTATAPVIVDFTNNMSIVIAPSPTITNADSTPTTSNNTSQADLSLTTTREEMVSVTAEHAIIDLTTDDPEPNIIDLEMNEAATSTAISKIKPIKARKAPRKLQEAAATTEPVNVDVPIVVDATDIITALPISTMNAVSAFPSTSHVPQDDFPLSSTKNENTTSTAKRKRNSKAQAAIKATRAPRSRWREIRKKTVEAPPAIEKAAAAGAVAASYNIAATPANTTSLPSSLVHVEKKKTTANKPNNTVPKEKAVVKRKSTSRKKAAKLVVEAEDIDTQDTSQVNDSKDDNNHSRKLKKQKPEPSTSAICRPSKEQPESSTSGNSRRQLSRRSHQEKKAKLRDGDDGNSKDNIVVDVDAAPVEEANDNQMQEEDTPQFQHYLELANSFLLSEDFRVLFPQLLARLSIAKKAKLAKLLLSPDLEDATASNPIPDVFLSPSNENFWNATRQFQLGLGMGGFDPEKIKERKEMRTAEQQKEQEDNFKDGNYQAYWGERLERDKKQMAIASTQAERLAYRVCEGERDGRENCGVAVSRDKGKGKALYM